MKLRFRGVKLVTPYHRASKQLELRTQLSEISDHNWNLAKNKNHYNTRQNVSTVWEVKQNNNQGTQRMGKMIFVNIVILQRDGRIWKKKLHEILTNRNEEG